MEFIAAIILLGLATAAIVVRKTYFYVPPRELKRQAEKQQPAAARLYRAAAYGSSLRGFLAVVIIVTAAIGLVLLARSVPVWLGVLVTALFASLIVVLPNGKIGRTGVKLTSAVTPAVAGSLNYLHPILSRSIGVFERRFKAAPHTGLFERADLLELLEQQQHQIDSRLSAEELEIARRALSFDDFKVADVLTPRANIKTVLASDTLGPILIDELHQSEQDYAIVLARRGGDVAGVLSIKKLGLSSQGSVADAMDPAVYYLHENDQLGDALHAFFVTNHPVFVVVNSFEEFVGTLSVSAILRQLLGHVPGDNFDQYIDRAAVAARHGKTPGPADPETDTPVKTD